MFVSPSGGVAMVGQTKGGKGSCRIGKPSGGVGRF